MENLIKKILVLGLVTAIVNGCAPSEDTKKEVTEVTPDSYAMDELTPAEIEAQLEQMDREYYEATGQSPFLEPNYAEIAGLVPSCKRETCAIYALVKKSEQRMYLYENGVLIGTYKTSTGAVGHSTPNFDTKPNGRIYDKYTSTKYPGGDYNGLGNMPYAVFISGGYAIHGTGKGNWQYLGQRASHGCIRVHPDNGFIFNRLVRKYGISQTWITVKD